MFVCRESFGKSVFTHNNKAGRITKRIGFVETPSKNFHSLEMPSAVDPNQVETRCIQKVF